MLTAHSCGNLLYALEPLKTSFKAVFYGQLKTDKPDHLCTVVLACRLMVAELHTFTAHSTKEAMMYQQAASHADCFVHFLQ